MKILTLLLTDPILFAKKIVGRLKRAYKLYILKDEFTVEVTRWFRENSDETLIRQ